MAQLKFNKKGVLIPQKISYDVKHDERDKELIDIYLKEKIDFQIDHDNEGNAIFVKKEKNNKEDK